MTPHVSRWTAPIWERPTVSSIAKAKPKLDNYESPSKFPTSKNKNFLSKSQRNLADFEKEENSWPLEGHSWRQKYPSTSSVNSMARRRRRMRGKNNGFLDRNLYSSEDESLDFDIYEEEILFRKEKKVPQEPGFFVDTRAESGSE